MDFFGAFKDASFVLEGLLSVSLLDIWLVLVGSAIFYVLYRYMYATYLSPLTLVPGPKADSWLLGHLPTIMKEEAAIPQVTWSGEYGGIVKYRGPFFEDRITVTDPTALRYILVTQSKIFPKTPFEKIFFRRAVGDGLLVTEGDVHKQQRKFLSPHFHFENLKELIPIFAQQAKKMAELWRREGYVDTKRDLDMRADMSRLTLDVIGLTGFGYEFDSMTNQGNELFAAVNRLLPKLDLWMVLVRYFPIVRKLPLERFRKEEDAARFLRAQVAKIIGDRREEMAGVRRKIPSKPAGESSPLLQDQDTSSKVHSSTSPAPGKIEHKTLLDMMMNDSYPDGRAMDDEELTAHTLTFVAAGHETTSNGLCWVFYMLDKHPEVEKELRKEVVGIALVFQGRSPAVSMALLETHIVSYLKIVKREVLGDSPADKVTWETLGSLPYTWAVCMETLRLYPPAPIISRRCDQTTLLPLSDGRKFVIPKDTLIFISPMAAHRVKKTWGEDVDVFRPERWFVDGDRQKRLSPQPFTFLPFLAGERSCIGQRFALLEMQVLLAVLISSYSLSLKPGTEVRRRLQITMRPHPGLTMHVRSV